MAAKQRATGSAERTGAGAERARLPLLLMLFVGSGCAALIYEIVWFQLLQMVVGSTAISLGVLLGTFMGGMCLGSLLFSRYVPASRHPLRVYAALELLIAAFGLMIVFGMPVVGQLYAHIGGQGFVGVVVRALLCGVLLLPPTMLMGATLPAIARWVEASPRGVAWMGFFYGGNTAGAVLGCLLAGFYLLRVFNMPTATFVAVALNVTVALLALGLARSMAYTPQSQAADTAPASRVTRLIYVTIALSGMTALGAEVIWTRLLSLLLGGTTYTFSIILAVFLIGIGLGSSIGAWVSRSVSNARTALGMSQLALTAAIAWTAFALARSLPYWPVNPGLVPSAWFLFEFDLARCMWAVFPASLLWGASFPMALAAASREHGRGDPARLVGRVYAANTVGAIVGALAFSILLVPAIGTQHAQQVLIGVAALAALLMVPSRGIGVVVTAVAALLVASVPVIPFELLAYGRQMPWRLNTVNELYRGEGMNSTIAVSELKGNGWRNFHVAGKIEASTEPQDMRLQRLLGNLPALVHPNPASVLVVGFGAGVTAGSFVPFPEMKHLTICEIEPLIPQVVSTFFGPQNFDVAKDPRVKIVYDDARHFILTTTEKYDLITSDPIHPWVKGAATLYTKEYFELVKAHLNPGGVVTQWVPLYESNEDAVKSEIATFLSVFPNGTVWGNLNNGEGYDVVLLGQEGNSPINLDAIDERMSREDHALARRSLSEVNFSSPAEIFATFAARGPDLAAWLRDAQINGDRDLRLQYLAGMSPDSYIGGPIYNQIVASRRFPDGLFTGSAERMQSLFARIGAPR